MTGAGEAIEAVQFKLTGALAAQYDLYYRVRKTGRFGWLDWAGNGETAGTEGFRYPVEGVEIVLMNKWNRLFQVNVSRASSNASNRKSCPTAAI